VREKRDQALRCQLAESFSDGCLAHLEALGQLIKVEPLSRFEVGVDD
jgi:hypothetical protein